MLTEELEHLVQAICNREDDPQTIACIPAPDGQPLDLYDLLSAFANQDEGGTIVFGIDQDNGCALTGVHGVLDLQQTVIEQCEQMEPEVEPLFTVCKMDGAFIVAAEIPATESAERPCYYLGKGVEQGACKRVGDHVESLSPYELYSFTADALHDHADGRPVSGCAPVSLDEELLDAYRTTLRSGRPSLASLSDDQLMALVGLERDGQCTLAEVELFGRYPQALFSQLCIVASRLTEEEDEDGMISETLVETTRIEGTIPAMLEQALTWALGSSDEETPEDGATIPVPREALREAVLNALEHRDYSPYTESIPVQLAVYDTRIEVSNPGGLYGSTRIEQLGTSWCDVRNTTLASALTTLGVSRGTQLGLTIMADAMDKAGCPEPDIWCNRSTFNVTLYTGIPAAPAYDMTDDTQKLLAFCQEPRSRAEIAELFGLSSVAYVTNHYIMPAVEQGLLAMSLPDKPRSKKQRYTTVQ